MHRNDYSDQNSCLGIACAGCADSHTFGQIMQRDCQKHDNACFQQGFFIDLLGFDGALTFGDNSVVCLDNFRFVVQFLDASMCFAHIFYDVKQFIQPENDEHTDHERRNCNEDTRLFD